MAARLVSLLTPASRRGYMKRWSHGKWFHEPPPSVDFDGRFADQQLRIRWLGHKHRISDGKLLLYGKMATHKGARGWHHLRFKDVCFKDIKAPEMDIDRSSWSKESIIVRSDKMIVDTRLNILRRNLVQGRGGLQRYKLETFWSGSLSYFGLFIRLIKNNYCEIRFIKGLRWVNNIWDFVCRRYQPNGCQNISMPVKNDIDLHVHFAVLSAVS